MCVIIHSEKSTQPTGPSVWMFWSPKRSWKKGVDIDRLINRETWQVISLFVFSWLAIRDSQIAIIDSVLPQPVLFVLQDLLILFRRWRQAIPHVSWHIHMDLGNRYQPNRRGHLKWWFSKGILPRMGATFRFMIYNKLPRYGSHGVVWVNESCVEESAAIKRSMWLVYLEILGIGFQVIFVRIVPW